MRQVFGAEAIGLSPQQEREMRDDERRRHERRRLLPSVYELTGLLLSGAFARRRLKAQRTDYTYANPRGSRGIWLYWTLECGPLYEARYRTGFDEDWVHRLLTVDADGTLMDICEEEARTCLENARWASMY